MEREGLARVSQMADYEHSRVIKKNVGAVQPVIDLFDYALAELEASVIDTKKIVSAAAERYFIEHDFSKHAISDEVADLLYDGGEFDRAHQLIKEVHILLNAAASSADIALHCLNFVHLHAPEYREPAETVLLPRIKNLITQEGSYA